MSLKSDDSHALDHLVLPVAAIDAARERLSRLGFVVAADGRHPFGTENACVFFCDKTYLEPLAIADEAEYRQAIEAGNIFVGRDAAFRESCGRQGFSAAVFATDDADADHRRFVSAGVSAGGMLRFERPFTMPDGSASIGAFKLAFAGDADQSGFFFFDCQRINAFPTDRTALETHPNGATGIREIVLSAARPNAFASLVEIASNHAPLEAKASGIRATLRNAVVSVLTPAALGAVFDLGDSDVGQGLSGRAIVFGVRDLLATAAVLVANGVDHMQTDNRILVPVQPGQGVVFAFEA